MASEGSSSSPEHALRNSRISKENLYMVLALWMEDFPVEPEEAVEPYKRVGAVLVLPNDMSYAVECSRNGVHGVARLLMAHQDILKDCKVFVSRKPCSLCTKLLVQSKVKRVLYLPVEPEYYVDDEKKFENEKSRVDELFKVSAIAQSVFVPEVGEEVIRYAKRKLKETPTDILEKEKKLMETYWKKGWMDTAREKLPWPAFDDKMKDQVSHDFHSVTSWMALFLIGSEEEKYAFKAEDEPTFTTSEPVQTSTASKAVQTSTTFKPFDPEGNDLERRQALHFITLAKFLAERTDDPIKGVGAVIVNKQKDVLGLGWNGFPTKALYGEFPRAAFDKEKDGKDNIKYPYIIHAEQNALLMRNTKTIAGATVFVTKTPCDECTPLLGMQGIKTFVLGVENMEKKEKHGISYRKFAKKVEDGDFTCFTMTKK